MTGATESQTAAVPSSSCSLLSRADLSRPADAPKWTRCATLALLNRSAAVPAFFGVADNLFTLIGRLLARSGSPPSAGARAKQLLIRPTTRSHPKWRRDRAAPVESIPRRYSGIVPFLRDIAFILRRLRYLRRGSMSGAFRERLILTVTAVNHCRYCAYSHTRLALRAGLKREAIESLLGGAIRDVPEREIPALLYARHWAENRARPDPEARHTLEQTYGSETAVTIEVVLRAIRLGNLTGNTFDALLCRASRGRFGRPADTPESAL